MRAAIHAARVAPAPSRSDDGSSDGFHYMRRKVQSCFTDKELVALIYAAANDPWLQDSMPGSVRLMDDDGHEADRETRDPAHWTRHNADGMLVVPYGPYGVELVKRAINVWAPDAPAQLPSLADEQPALKEIGTPRSSRMNAIMAHEFVHAWRLRWVDAEARFRLEESRVPQVWWAVAQNVIVPLKVLELNNRHEAFKRMLRLDRAWGAAGHVAWVLSKGERDDLSSDPMFCACMAVTPPETLDGWLDGADASMGWPTEPPRLESRIMADEGMMRAIAAKWAARKWAEFPSFATKDELVVIQARAPPPFTPPPTARPP